MPDHCLLNYFLHCAPRTQLMPFLFISLLAPSQSFFLTSHQLDLWILPCLRTKSSNAPLLYLHTVLWWCHLTSWLKNLSVPWKGSNFYLTPRPFSEFWSHTCNCLVDISIWIFHSISDLIETKLSSWYFLLNFLLTQSSLFQPRHPHSLSVALVKTPEIILSIPHTTYTISHIQSFSNACWSSTYL